MLRTACCRSVLAMVFAGILLSGCQVSGVARYIDENMNGIADKGDLLIVPFNQNVTVNGATVADFDLPVEGDRFGFGATVESGPAPNEVTIRLGGGPVVTDSPGIGFKPGVLPDIDLPSGPNLKSRQTFDPANLSPNAPSGIDVSATMTPHAIVATEWGVDVTPSTPIDIIPAFREDTAHALGAYDTFSLALGDIDRDGDLDVVAGNGFLDDNRVWINDGTGAFSDSGQSPGSRLPAAVALGDLDADGDLDLVIGNWSTGANQVFFNDGTGAFTDSGQALGNRPTTSIALGDIDRDGDLDLVVGNGRTTSDAIIHPNRVWFNDGTGFFTDSGQSPGGLAPSDVALGDLDGDGDLDLVIGNYPTKVNQVLFNDGSGTFTDSGQELGGSSTRSVALGDLDKDGDLDLATGNYAQPNRIWLNDGTGVFTASQTLGTGKTFAVVLVDYDADGDIDLVSGNDAEPNRVWLNGGSGTFTDSGLMLGNRNTLALALGDIDRDGDLDMLTGNVKDQPNALYRNSLTGTWGMATFTDSGQALGTRSTMDLALGDIDGDGDLDLVTANWDLPDANRVWFNDGTGTYTDSGQLLGANFNTSVALGDIDLDGDLDMVVGNGLLGNRVWVNDGTGTFTDTLAFLGSSPTHAVALGDVDGDGDPDLVTGNIGPNRVWTNVGPGVFIDSGQELGSGSTFAVALGDLDADGDLDLVEGLDGDRNVVWLNNGAGLFTDSGIRLGSPTAEETHAIRLGDLEGDGDLDVVAAAFDGPNFIRYNSGTEFNSVVVMFDGSASRSAILGDMDGDGDLDIATANFLTPNRVLFNRGGLVFLDSGQLLVVGTNPAATSIWIADVDGDGDLDLVSGYDLQPNRIWLNE